MAKKMIVNAAVCDMRNVTEETLAAYEEIQVNAAKVFVNRQAKALLAKYPITLNCADTIEVDGEVKVNTVNGSAEISCADTPEWNIYLTVNGSLRIGPDTEEVLKHYVGISVNGSLTYPKSMSGKIGALQVNGSVNCYPDGAVLLKRTAVIDKLFVLRAKPGLYWAARRMILVDPALDGAALAEKGVKFSTKSAILAESLAEQAAALFDDSTDIEIVPDGTAVVRDDLNLNRAAFRRYGGRLYVIGDVTIEEDAGELLPELEYLHVEGEVRLPVSLAEAFASVKAEYNELLTVKGRVIADRPAARVTRWMLEREAEGVLVLDCAMVTLDKDIGPGLIADRLSIRDCAAVNCTPEQEAAVAMIAQDVAEIGPGAGDADGAGLGGLLGGILDPNCKTVNAATYVM